MAKTSKDDADGSLIATNRRARHDFFVEDQMEAGIVLQGCEVKSLRDHHVSLTESYATVKDGQVWLQGARISPYPAARDNPDPDRERKLLLNRREIRRLERAVREKGYTLIPLRMYFSDRGHAKVLLGLCRGKRQYDKREAIAARDYEVRKQRALAEQARGDRRS